MQLVIGVAIGLALAVPFPQAAVYANSRIRAGWAWVKARFTKQEEV